MTRTPTRRGLAALGVTTVLALATAAPARSADALADGNGFVPGGQGVKLSVASGQGTPLSPGLFSATLPVDETARYVELQRGEGERLEVSVVGSATWKDNAWTTSTGSQGLQIELSTPDGATSCATSSQSMSSTTVPGMLSTTVAVDEARTERMGGASSSSMPEACLKATSYRLEIKRSNDGDAATEMPVQIAVQRAPRVTGEVKVPSGDVSDMSTAPLSAAGSVTPGNGFANATTLSAGGHDLEAPVGRRMFFRVHLSWGQRMSVGWELPKNGADFKPAQDLQMKMSIFNPALVPATMTGSGSDSGYLFTSSSSEAKEMGAFTAPIDYGNANVKTSGDDSIRWQSTPGWYYVALDISPSSTTQKFDDSQKVPSVLSVRFDGSPTAGPAMSLAQPDPGTISGVGKTSTNPLLWGGALLLGLGAVGGLGYVLWRRETSSRT